MVDDLMKCQITFRESCIKTGVRTNYNKKSGFFTPEERKNVDGNSLPFLFDLKRTYDYIAPKEKHHSTWISQPGSALDKRQCLMQVMLRSSGKQPVISVIFRSGGKRISANEKRS